MKRAKLYNTYLVIRIIYNRLYIHSIHATSTSYHEPPANKSVNSDNL